MNALTEIVYKYFTLKKIEFPYIKSILVMIGIISLHLYLVFTVFKLFDLFKEFKIKNITVSGSMIILVSAICFLLFFLIGIRKSTLNRFNFTNNQLIRKWRKMVLYNLFILLLLIAVTYL